jgi:hypothetical protein
MGEVDESDWTWYNPFFGDTKAIFWGAPLSLVYYVLEYDWKL